MSKPCHEKWDTEENLSHAIRYWTEQMKPTVSHINGLKRRLASLRKYKKEQDDEPAT